MHHIDLGQPPTESAIRAKLAKVRRKYDWAAGYTDELLIRVIKKWPDLFEEEDVSFFKWGADPVTRGATAVKETVTGPAFQLLLWGGLALVLLSLASYWRPR